MLHISESPVVFNWSTSPCIIWPHFTFPLVCVSCDHSIVISVDWSLVGFFSPLSTFSSYSCLFQCPSQCSCIQILFFFFLHMNDICSMKMCLTLCHERQCKLLTLLETLCAVFSVHYFIERNLFFFCCPQLNIICVFLMVAIIPWWTSHLFFCNFLP